MILDKQQMFSEDQAITASAASTNVIDLGATSSKIQTIVDKLGSENLGLNIQVTADFNNLTNLKFGVQTDDAEAFSGAVTLMEFTEVLANLKAGYVVPINKLTMKLKRYVRLYYTVTGTAPTTGKVSAGLVLDQQVSGI